MKRKKRRPHKEPWWLGVDLRGEQSLLEEVRCCRAITQTSAVFSRLELKFRRHWGSRPGSPALQNAGLVNTEDRKPSHESKSVPVSFLCLLYRSTQKLSNPQRRDPNFSLAFLGKVFHILPLKDLWNIKTETKK